MDYLENGKYTSEALWEMDGGDTRSDLLRDLMSRSLTHVPAEVANQILEGCILLVETPGDAYFVPLSHIRGRAILLFSNEAIESERDDPDAAIDLFLHESAHFLFDHRDPMALGLEQYKKQELEAWQQVADWRGYSGEWVNDQVSKFASEGGESE